MQNQSLTITQVPGVCEGIRTINTLKRLISEVSQWATETKQPALADAMRDAYGLVVTCWTEFDEGLRQLSSAVRQIERGDTQGATESIGHAMRYMHRWQDRDGAIGNIECLTEDEISGLIFEDGSKMPASFASAKIDRLDDLERTVKGLRIIRSVFGNQAKLIINPGILNTDALREVWPQLLDRLVPESKH